MKVFFKDRGTGIFCTLLIIAAFIPPICAQSVPSGTWGPDGVVIERNVMVPMRDGVRLATDVYLPAKDGQILPGKFPTLLTRTPYGKIPAPITPGTVTSEQAQVSHEAYYFASHGYAVVEQDVRGRFNSEGVFGFHTQEGADGYDTLEWAASQPWSDGRVATYGGSYLATTQNALAALKPPYLVAMFVSKGDSNYYADSAYRGGEFFLLHNLMYPLAFAATSHDAIKKPAIRAAALNDLADANLSHWLKAYPYPHGASPLRIVPTLQAWFQTVADHYTFDSYWRQNGYDFENRYKDFPDIPIYYVSGWYDLYERGSLHNYVGMHALHKSRTKLVMGPWIHDPIGTRTVGDVDFGQSAHVSMVELATKWFDRILKGQHNELMTEPPVRIFIMGGGSGLRNVAGKMEDGGEWYDTTAWPLPEAKPTPYYLHANGTLSEDAPGKEAPNTFTYDPHHPVPTIGGQIDFGATRYEHPGPIDQVCKPSIPFCGNHLPLSSRRDVLVFETPALQSDVVVAGPVTVDLWISSSAPDTDFTAKLIDQSPPSADYPQGFSMNLENWIVRASLYPGFQKRHLLKPSEIREVKIDLQGVANRFVKGHRIRLDISSSNFPLLAVNPNTGERPGHETHMVIARNTVYHDREHPSQISLPLLQESALDAHLLSKERVTRDAKGLLP